jgi:hypothetical protein
MTDADAYSDSLEADAMDWENEKLLALKDACRLVPGRTGRGIAVSTLWRWIQIGCAGIKLDSITIGTQRYVSKESLRRFVTALNERRAPGTLNGDGALQADGLRDDADEQLQAEGL